MRVILAVGLGVSLLIGALALWGPGADLNAMEIDDLILTYLDESWVNESPNAGGGYAARPDLSDTPSLYRTAWMLRLAEALGVEPKHLVVARAARWLESIIADAHASTGLPRLEAVALATQALDGLGVSFDTVPIAAAVDELRVGRAYRWDPGRSPDLTATARAIETLSIVGAAVPDDVVRAVADEFSNSVATSFTPDQYLERLLPLWIAATLTVADEDRGQVKEAMRRQLVALTRSIELTASPGALSALRQAKAVAAANDISLALPEVKPNTFAANASGFLSLTVGNTFVEDPQLTFDAILLGWPAPPGLMEALRVSAGDTGWGPPPGQPDPESTYYGMSISRALDSSERWPSIALEVRRWLEADHTSGPIDEASARRMMFEIGLAQDLGIEVPPEMTHSIQVFVASASETDPSIITRLPLEILARPEVALASGQPDEPQQPSLHQAFAVWLRGRMSNQSSLTEAGRRAALRFRTAAGACEYAAQAPTVDLVSTAVCRRMEVSGVSTAALDLFADRAGFWYLPPSVKVGNAVTLRSIYLGLFLAGRIYGPAALVF